MKLYLHRFFPRLVRVRLEGGSRVDEIIVLKCNWLGKWLSHQGLSKMVQWSGGGNRLLEYGAAGQRGRLIRVDRPRTA
jgi:hypothetical protein